MCGEKKEYMVWCGLYNNRPSAYDLRSFKKLINLVR